MRSFSLWLVGLIIVLIGSFLWWEPAAADFAPDTAVTLPQQQVSGDDRTDLACLLCHQDTTAEITFPSGETISAQIDLDSLAHSVHGSGDEALTCTDCHNPNAYRSPHSGVTAPDYASYRLEKAAACEQCHVQPHLDSHTQLAAAADTAVACQDCHGEGHTVQPAAMFDAETGTAVCADCHTEKDATTTDPAGLFNAIQYGLFDRQPGENYCLACHTQPGLTMTFANGDAVSITVDPDGLHDSVHGADNPWQPLACANCHRDTAPYPHEPVTAASARQFTLSQYGLCEQCHNYNYERATNSVHGDALQEGNENAAVCIDCHGSHEIPTPNEPRARISHICEQCHSEIFNEYAESVHGAALLEEDNPDVPTCIDCHGVHDINDPTTNLFRVRSPELCAKCHANVELMDKYEISTDVFETYVADFHGETVTLFEQLDPTAETNKAVCYDCHGIHNILPPDAPHAGIKTNLLATCQQCHPDATDNFPDAWTSHFRPSLEHNPLVYLVNLFYDIVIPLTVGFFAFMVFTDIYRRVRERVAGRRAAGGE